MNNPQSKEEIREILTRQLGKEILFHLSFPHPNYTISTSGFVRYNGDNVWTVGSVTFPLSAVVRIGVESRRIYLEG